MEQRLSLVTLGVGDLARARAFYEALGWRAALVVPDEAVFFQLGAIALGLYGRAALARDAGRTPETGPTAGFAGIALAHNTRTREEVDRLLAEAEAAGGRVAAAARDHPRGVYSGYFADPDGHLWEVAWNPAFPLDAAGALTVPPDGPT